MAISRAGRWFLIVIGVASVLAVMTVTALHLAARSLHKSVIEALGPESEVEDLTVGFTRIVITGVRIKPGRGWPTADALRAARVVVVPDLRQLIARRIHVSTVTIEDAYISAVRPKEGGGLKVLPALLERSRNGKAERSGRTAVIDTVELKDCLVEVFDATVVGRQKVRIDAVHGTLEDVTVPGLEGRTKFDLKGAIKGQSHTGTIAVAGWVEGKSAAFTTRVRNVDLALFEPYLVQKTRSGIDRGTFNLDLEGTVKNNMLDAPGTLVLDGLKLKTGEGAFSGLSNIPRRAVLGALADENQRITLEFAIRGDLDNPAFSLSQSLALKTGFAFLQGLGLGFEGLIRAFYVIVHGFGSAFGSLAG